MAAPSRGASAGLSAIAWRFAEERDVNFPPGRGAPQQRSSWKWAPAIHLSEAPGNRASPADLLVRGSIVEGLIAIAFAALATSAVSPT
jgi:hypothetical protein